jgi:hypothetical protein
MRRSLAYPFITNHPTARTALWITLAVVISLSLAACQMEAPAPALQLTIAPYTLEKIDPHPLYVMHYNADYREEHTQIQHHGDLPWACSLFVALGDAESMVYGRNFDWYHSPAVVLYTSPPDGFRSISTVNLNFLGFSSADAGDLLNLSESARKRLLEAPYLPIDGMNEAGLVVGMAAVPHSQDETDLSRPSIDSLGVMRELLDYADTVPEALEIMSRYTIDFGGGPPIHYLIADANGEAALVEYGRGAMNVIPNESPWHLATNFLLESASGDPRDTCWRYQTLAEKLTSASGRLSGNSAMDLLQDVSQEGTTGTQWSAVYILSTGLLHLAMGREYQTIHHFDQEDILP